MRAADAIVQSLTDHGVERFYCVPGESYLTLLDALHGSDVQTIICRHESGAGFMAVSEAKLTGRTAVCAVSRGPGATNASIAVHVAQQDAAPLVLFIGQVARDELARGAFQEVDYTQFFGSMCKAVFEVIDPAKLGETLSRAFHIASSGVPGPVAISLPEDILELEANAAPLPYPVVHHRHSRADIEQIQALIGLSERPVILAGAVLRGAGSASLARFAEAQRIPVGTTWKNQDVFDNASALYAGHIGFGIPASFRTLLSKADLVIAAGTRLGDVASLNYQFPKAPQPEQPLIHIYPDSAPIGAVFRPTIGLAADPAAVFDDLSRDARVANSARESWISEVNGFIRNFQIHTPASFGDGVDFGSVVTALEKAAPADAIITTDAGNMSTWVHRHWRMTPRNTLLGAIAGAMGYGVPAAVAAQLAAPERMAICFVGDGGVLMTGQELATALQFGAKPKIVISDNGSYGTIRTHQERQYPGRISGTRLSNPDFTAWAASFGARAFTISSANEVTERVEEALSYDGAAVIHVKSSLKAISAYVAMPDI
ncbi:MAG: acetolactate synthase [Rhizobiales bacterium]|nr:acetolactate synthase [Hyphomicrobiales bacterium]